MKNLEFSNLLCAGIVPERPTHSRFQVKSVQWAKVGLTFY